MEKNVPGPVRRIAQLQRNTELLDTTDLLLNIGSQGSTLTTSPATGSG